MKNLPYVARGMFLLIAVYSCYRQTVLAIRRKTFLLIGTRVVVQLKLCSLDNAALANGMQEGICDSRLTPPLPHSSKRRCRLAGAFPRNAPFDLVDGIDRPVGRIPCNLEGVRLECPKGSSNRPSSERCLRFAGHLFIPLAGIVWEVFPGLVFYKVFNVGTFNPVTWAATYLLAVAINAGLEWTVIQKGFRLSIGKRGFWIIASANAISVAVAFGSLSVFPVEP